MICEQCQNPKLMGTHSCIAGSRVAQQMTAAAQSQYVWQGIQGSPRPTGIVQELRDRAAKLRQRMIEHQRDQKELETIERMLQAVDQ